MQPTVIWETEASARSLSCLVIGEVLPAAAFSVATNTGANAAIDLGHGFTGKDCKLDVVTLHVLGQHSVSEQQDYTVITRAAKVRPTSSIEDIYNMYGGFNRGISHVTEPHSTDFLYIVGKRKEHKSFSYMY